MIHYLAKRAGPQLNHLNHLVKMITLPNLFEVRPHWLYIRFVAHILYCFYFYVHLQENCDQHHVFRFGDVCENVTHL